MKKEDLMLEVIELKKYMEGIKIDFNSQKDFYDDVYECMNKLDNLLSSKLDLNICLEDEYDSILKSLFTEVLEKSKFCSDFYFKLIGVRLDIKNSSSDDIKNNYSDILEEIEQTFNTLKYSTTNIGEFNFSYICIVQLLDSILENDI